MSNIRTEQVKRDVLAYIDWVWELQWRASLDLARGDASWDQIAAAIGVSAPLLRPGDVLPSELGTAQLYWPETAPRCIMGGEVR